jgi:uncharacterized protein YneF (UPF0154 family)
MPPKTTKGQIQKAISNDGRKDSQTVIREMSGSSKKNKRNNRGLF